MPAAPRPSPLLIMGEQRSGTTFLLQVLDARPEIALHSGLLSRVLSQAWRWRLHLDTPLSRRQRHVLLQALRTFWVPADDLPHVALGTDDFGSLGDLLDFAFSSSAPGARLSGHKVHGPAPMLPALLKQPSLRAIYIVRDVRDVILSRWYRGEDLLDSHVLRWRQALRRVRSLQDHPRLHVLRFEDLVHAATSELARLRSFLGVAPEPGQVRVAPELFNTSFGDLTAPFDPRATSRWRSHWREPLVRYAAWVCRRELAAFGYDVDCVCAIPARQRRRFASRRLRAEALHAAARGKESLARFVLPAWT